MSAPGSSWQCAELAVSFTERRRVLVPLLDIQEDVVRQLLCRHRRPVVRFLDLGAGAGAMSDLVLGCKPGCEGVLVDFSEPMLELVHANLIAYPGRWQVVRADLSQPSWQAELPAGNYDTVVSGLALHHLSAERKRALFAELLALLEPGGMFVNLDYVAIDGPLRGLFDEQMLANALRAERQSGGNRSAQEVDCEDDDDQPDSVEDQLHWLRDAGFEQAEVHFKWAEAAVFGAIKPS